MSDGTDRLCDIVKLQMKPDLETEVTATKLAPTRNESGMVGCDQEGGRASDMVIGPFGHT